MKNLEAIKIIRKEMNHLFEENKTNSELWQAYAEAIEALEKHSLTRIEKYHDDEKYMVHLYCPLDEFVNITPDDIIDKLSDEDKKNFNRCEIEQVLISKYEDDECIEFHCRVFKEE